MKIFFVTLISGNKSIIIFWPYHGCNGEATNTILRDRYHLQNCKAITFEKIANHTKYEKRNVPSHLHIF